MAVDVITALGLVGLGGLLGAAGQGARVVVGLKKAWQAAAQDERIKELVSREEELHAKLKALRDDERRLDEEEKKEQPPTKPSSKRANLNEERKLVLQEKAMVMSQRQALRWFDGTELLVSLLIAFIVGAIAGVLSGVQLLEGEFEEITQGTMLGIILAGYAGTDFIEGFITQKLPK